jgi:hypothetical protein
LIESLEIDLLFSQVALGDHVQAVRAADAMRKKIEAKSDSPAHPLYRLACVYALSVAAVEEARGPQPLTEEDRALQAQYRDKALTALERFHQRGNRDSATTRNDSDFISIRGDPRFQRILEMEKKGK